MYDGGGDEHPRRYVVLGNSICRCSKFREWESPIVRVN